MAPNCSTAWSFDKYGAFNVRQEADIGSEQNRMHHHDAVLVLRKCIAICRQH